MNEDATPRSTPRPPSALEALVPVVMLVALIFLGIVLYGGDLVAGPVHVALIFCAIVAGLIGVKNCHAMEDMGKAPSPSRRLWHSHDHDHRLPRRRHQTLRHPCRPTRTPAHHRLG